MDDVKEWTYLPELLQRPSAEETRRGPVLKHPSRPPDDLAGHGTELN